MLNKNVFEDSEPDNDHWDIIVGALTDGNLDKSERDVVSLDFLLDDFLNRFQGHVVPQPVAGYDDVSMMQPDGDTLYVRLRDQSMLFERSVSKGSGHCQDAAQSVHD